MSNDELILVGLAVATVAFLGLRTRGMKKDRAERLNPALDQVTPEIARAEELLANWITLQSSTVGLQFKGRHMTPWQKSLFAHFSFGACQRVAQMLADQADAPRFFVRNSEAIASLVYSDAVAKQELNRYCVSGVPELHAAGQRGFQAMNILLNSDSGEFTEAEILATQTAMYKVVRVETEGM